MIDAVIIRPADMGRSQDDGFVFRPWLEAVKVSGFGHGIPRALFMHAHHEILDRVLARGAVVRMACYEADHDTLLGCAVLDPPAGILHWVYVKPVHQHKGIASLLLAGMPAQFSCTHLTEMGDRVLRQWRQGSAIRSSKCPSCSRGLRRVTTGETTQLSCPATKCGWNLTVDPAVIPPERPAVIYNPYLLPWSEASR